MSDGKSIDRTIRSVLTQGVSVEIIVVDNFSQDSTLEACKQYGVLPRVRAGSRSAARNYGLEHAVGQFVLFLDSDHELEPGALPAAIRMAIGGKLDAIFLRTKYLQVDSASSISISPLQVELKLRRGIRFPNFYRRSVLDGIKFRSDFDLGEDYLLLLQLSQRKVKVGEMEWGLKHYSNAGLNPVWRRSLHYGRAYRRGHGPKLGDGFLKQLGLWSPGPLRNYWNLWRKSPQTALWLAQFLAVKYVAFLVGFMTANRKDANKEGS